MCPYFNKYRNECTIFDNYTPETDSYDRDCKFATWCTLGIEPYTKCPNYLRAKDIHDGVVPPPSYYD